MQSFNYTYPTRVYFGEHCASDAFRKESAAMGKRVMLAYGGGSIRKNGIYDEIRSLLESMDKEIFDFSGIMPNPTYAKAQEGAQLVRKEKIDFILAVGGGSVIDCCKVISAQAALNEDIYEMEYTEKKFPSGGVPVGAVVTASGTGAEMNCGAVITREEQMWKGPIFATLPCFAVLDPMYTLSVPQIQVISGAFDTLSHAMETYFGNSDRDNVSDDLSLAIMKNTVKNIRRLLADNYDLQARGNLMWDSAMAENGILKCGRKTDFQVHQIEHQLGAYTNCNHGQGLAVIQPVYLRHIANAASEKCGRMAREVFGADTSYGGVSEFAHFVRECGLPSSLRELKSSVPITLELLKKVADSCNLISTNPKPLDRKEIYDILVECM